VSRLSGFTDEQTRALTAELAKLRAELLRPTDPIVDRRERATVRPQPGDVVRVQGGQAVVLPHARAARGASVTLLIEDSTPDVVVTADSGEVNGAQTVALATTGRYEFTSSGRDWWGAGGVVTPTPPAAPVDAQYVLGAADAELPNGAVATDSAEVDVTVTPGGTATWALRDGSVGLARLEDIPDQTVLGNNSGSDGPPEPVTVHEELDWVGGDVRWRFDGVDDRATIANTASLDIATATTPFTFACRLQSTSPTGGLLMGKKSRATLNSPGADLSISAGKIGLIIGGGGAALILVQTNASFSDGADHTIMGVFGGAGAASVVIYVDGVAQATTTFSNTLGAASPSNSVATVLGNSSDLTVPFDGILFHCAQWNAALTAPDAVAVHNGGVPPDLLALSSAPNLVGWWKLDGADATGANGILDYSTGNHPATAAGGLAPSGATGSMLVRNTAVWQLLPPAPIGRVLTARGVTSLPSFEQPSISMVNRLVANVAATNATTNLSCGSFTVPANNFSTGLSFDLEGQYVFVHTAATTPTITHELVVGGTVLQTLVVTPDATAATFQGRVRGTVVCRSTGSSGAFMGSMWVDANYPTGYAAGVVGTTGTSTGARDTTTALAVELRVRMTTAVASNTLTVIMGYVQRSLSL
jgi:hypothetical protein